MAAYLHVNVIFTIYGRFGQSGSRIPDAWFAKPTFSLKVTFYLKIKEKRTKNSLGHLWYYYMEQRHNFWQEHADINKSKKALILNGTFSKTINVCTYIPKFQVSSIILTTFRQEVITPRNSIEKHRVSFHQRNKTKWFN